LISYWIDFGASYGPPDLTWRFPIAFQCVFGIFIMISMFVLPESPRWLFSRERYEEGETVIAALADQPIDHHEVQLQKTIILDSIRAYVTFSLLRILICTRLRSITDLSQFWPGEQKHSLVGRLHWR
jgi:hypothetical protein